ncbi:MAG: very short patch repair endonuclease [Phycisphaerales bacterium]
MADTLTPAQRSDCMAAVRGKNTTPERTVRSILHRLGCRFALHRANLHGKPDIVMPARGLIVLVHGCFWHMHSCKRGRSTPATNAAFWNAKRTKNRARDRRTVSALRRAGWRVLVVWECQTGNAEELTARLSKVVLAPHPYRNLRPRSGAASL